MNDLILSFIQSSYKCFIGVTHPVFNISCAAVLIGFAVINFAIRFIHSFIGASSGNSSSGEDHYIVRR